VVLPPWLTIGQTAEYCGVDRAEVYSKMLRDLEVRRIGVRGGAAPFGRLIRCRKGRLSKPLRPPLPLSLAVIASTGVSSKNFLD
jgi:hypothetical protein